MRHPAPRRSTRLLLTALSLQLALPGPGLLAQVVLPLSVQRGEEEHVIEMRMVDATLEVVLDNYADLTGRTLIISPAIPSVLINLKSKEKLTETEYLIAIESVLAMHQVALIPLGDKFLRVVPAAELRTHGEEILMGTPGEQDSPTDKIETRILEVQYLELAEVQPIIDSLRHPYGKVQLMERSNAFMITDTVAVHHRIAEILTYLDKPTPTKVETRVYRLNHAEAAEVASRLNELIEESQSQQPVRTAARPAATSAPGGIIRAGTTAAQRAAAAAAAAQAAAQQPQSEAASLAERGIIQGQVKMVSDERTNILIVISEPQNFDFFDKIVAILDEQVDPAIAVEVVRLEFADAEDISGILNEFVGAATADSQRTRTEGRGATATEASAEDSRAQALRDFVARQSAARTVATSTTAANLAQGVGRLDEGTSILADERTNSILLMGRRSDIETLRGIIEQLDVMLAQVMIEAVIIEVSLDDDFRYGIDWLQRSYELYNEERLGPGGSVAVRQPVAAFGGAQNLNDSTFLDASQVTRNTAMAAGSLSYYATFFDLNLDVVLQMAASSSNAEILSTPIVVTTDNTEARIFVGESRPTVSSTSITAGGVDRSSYQYQEIGIELTVTPRINPEKFVVMEITQSADNVGGFELIDGNNVPVITQRELEAEIAVANRSSIVLGGLIGTESRKARAKIPLLGNIPILGALFRNDNTSKNRTELIVIITPYVMSTPEEVRQESRRINDRSSSGEKWDKTWSDSPLLMRDGVGEESAPAPLLDRAYEELLEDQAQIPETRMRRNGDQPAEEPAEEPAGSNSGSWESIPLREEPAPPRIPETTPESEESPVAVEPVPGAGAAADVPAPPPDPGG